MRLDVKALSITFALLGGISILLVGLVNAIWPPYGTAFLTLTDSFYPAFGGGEGFGSVILRTLFASLDGAIGGAVIAWVYNKVLDRTTAGP